jgi:hypothetical protein
MTVDWENEIRFYFTQYDRLKMLFFCDLGSYEDVKQYAESLYASVTPNSDPDMASQGWSQMPNVHVMPKYEALWPDSKRAAFRSWIDAGCPRGAQPPGPPAPSPVLPEFIALSQILTGFDDLGGAPATASAFLVRLLARPDAPRVSAAIEQFKVMQTQAGGDASKLLDAIGAALSANGDFQAVARTLIELWYTAAFLDPASGFATDAGTALSNQYAYGLAWRAASAHPMGFSLEERYWQSAPQSDGTNTGLAPLSLLNGRNYTGRADS